MWPNPVTGKGYDEELEDMINIEAALGLSTSLKCENRKSSSPEGSQELKCFLKQVEEEILKQSDDMESNNNKESASSFRARSLIEELGKLDQVVVPTDKTNSFRLMGVEMYKEEVCKHLDE
jgi:hypothetical protein